MKQNLEPGMLLFVVDRGISRKSSAAISQQACGAGPATTNLFIRSRQAATLLDRNYFARFKNPSRQVGHYIIEMPSKDNKGEQNQECQVPVSRLMLRWRPLRLVRAPRASGMGPA